MTQAAAPFTMTARRHQKLLEAIEDGAGGGRRRSSGRNRRRGSGGLLFFLYKAALAAVIAIALLGALYEFFL